MNTKRVETKVYTEHMYCDCGGEMKRNTNCVVLCTYPEQYGHSCINCGKTAVFTHIYPRIVYEEVEHCSDVTENWDEMYK